jgi:cellulose synthase/poly-beta-1,6-N-acetylglucosamine synthase-like glycosyltransferase
VLHQWAADAYVDAQRGEYATGLLGRNCALRRTALEEAGAFDADVRTGTDYYLAKTLLVRGVRLRFVPESTVATRYPETVESYSRRQSRWVRNPIIHGPAFGAHGEAVSALRTGLVGLGMLLLPGSAAIVGPVALVLWGILFVQAHLARLRYLRFLHSHHDALFGLGQVLRTPAYLLTDFAAWSRSLFDLFLNRGCW